MNIRNNPPNVVRKFMPPHALFKYHELYDDITNNGLKLEFQDRHALGELAMMIVEADMLRQQLAEKGEHIEMQGDRNKVTKKNPARDALERLRPHIHKYYLAFGMLPSTRKQKIINAPNTDNVLDDGFGNV